MSTAIAASLSAQTNLLALLQAKADALNLGIKLTAGGVKFDAPAAVSQTDSSGKTYNTSVLVSALPGSGLTGSATVYFNRLKLAESVLAPQSSYTLQSDADNATVIALVEKALGLVAGEVTLSGEVVRPADGSSLTLSVKAAATSLVYTEDDFQITLTWSVDLAGAFSDPYLDGFVPAEEQESTAEQASTGEVESTGEISSS